MSKAEKKPKPWAGLTTRTQLEVYAQRAGYKNPAFWAGKILEARAAKRKL